MLKHIIGSFALSWIGAVALGLIYGAALTHRTSPQDLWVMGVVQISFIISSLAALLITPLTAWALYHRVRAIKWLVPLWILLALYCLIIAPQNAMIALYGALAFAAVGLVCIRRFTRV